MSKLPDEGLDFQKISGSAFELWKSFLDASAGRDPIHLFKHDPRFEVNGCVTHFLRFCAAMKTGLLHPAEIVFATLSKSNGKGGSDDRPVSWLWRKNGVPMVVIDKDVILKQPIATVSRAMTRVVLHEIGHVVHHWDKLNPAGKGHVKFPASEPQHEAEAWWFAQAIVAAAVGALARQYRVGGNQDQAWSHA